METETVKYNFTEFPLTRNIIETVIYSNFISLSRILYKALWFFKEKINRTKYLTSQYYFCTHRALGNARFIYWNHIM